MKYTIEIPEIHKSVVEVEAPVGTSLADLLVKAQTEFDANGSDILEYSHTLEHDQWTVRDENGNYVKES